MLADLRDYDVSGRLYGLLLANAPQILPKIRMIAILREPISRDLSNYNMLKELWANRPTKMDATPQGRISDKFCQDASVDFPSYHEGTACKVKMQPSRNACV